MLRVLAVHLSLFLLVFGNAQVLAQQNNTRRTRRMAEISAIEAYCQEIDTYVQRNERVARIFGNVASFEGADRWREFRNEQEREQEERGDNLNENAHVWLRSGRVIRANFLLQSPSRDWAHYVDYYYRPDGTLAKIRSRLNTFYGRMIVIRTRLYDERGRLLRASTPQYLDLTTQRRQRPDRDFIDEPIPVYRRVLDLPFYVLLSNRRQTPTTN